MNCDQKSFDDKMLSITSCYEDKFTLNNHCNSKITILSHECKACLLSYKICLVNCKKILFVYGAILSKLIYTYEHDCKRHSQIFIKPFSKEICLPASASKVLSLSTNLLNKYTKRLCNDLLLGFYTLEFCIKLKCPIENICDDFNNKNLSEICSSNILDLNEDCSMNSNNYHDNSFNFTAQQSMEQKILNDIQNDCFNSLSSTPYNTRL